MSSLYSVAQSAVRLSVCFFLFIVSLILLANISLANTDSPSPPVCSAAVKLSHAYVTAHRALIDNRKANNDISQSAYDHQVMSLNDQEKRLTVNDCMLSDAASFQLYLCLIEKQGAYNVCRIQGSEP